MGVDATYGTQKYWNYGQAFDGAYKAPIKNFTYGPTSDYLFNPSNLGAIVYAAASTTAGATVQYAATAHVLASATATVIRKIGGASARLGDQSFWTYGLPQVTLPKNDFGAEKYWGYGLTDADLFPKNALVGVARASSTASASSSVHWGAKAFVLAGATATVLRKLPGFVDPKGHDLWWHYGETYFAVSNQQTDLFRDQTLWYYGLPTPDLIPLAQLAAVSNDPLSKFIGGYPRKRQMAHFPILTKTIAAKIPRKRSNFPG